MARVPAIMRETLLFPYTTGAAFVQGRYGQGDWAAVDAMYDRMPESTEQILHPEDTTSNEEPIDVKLPADLAKRLGAGWTVPLEDTFGEFQTAIWLRESGVDLDAANDAAAGWGGDRMAVAEGPGRCVGRRLEDRVGHRGRRGRVRGRRRDRPRERPAARRGSSPARAARPAGS